MTSGEEIISIYMKLPCAESEYWFIQVSICLHRLALALQVLDTGVFPIIWRYWGLVPGLFHGYSRCIATKLQAFPFKTEHTEALLKILADWEMGNLPELMLLYFSIVPIFRQKSACGVQAVSKTAASALHNQMLIKSSPFMCPNRMKFVTGILGSNLAQLFVQTG